jgi:hypothetical protein
MQVLSTPLCSACRFIQVAYPTSAEGLQAAGVLEADALLLAAEESTRGNSAEADAQVRSVEGFFREGGEPSRVRSCEQQDGNHPAPT